MKSPQISFAFLALLLLLLIQIQTSLSYQYKVGDLDSWGVPPPSNKHVYSYWSQRYHFQIGDSLLFLYPPSQDSVIQVTMQAFNSCSVSAPGHCQKNQKLEVAVPMANGTFMPPADDGVAAGPGSAMSPSSSAFPIVFGPSAAAAERSAAAEVRVAVAIVWAVVLVGVFLVNLV